MCPRCGSLSPNGTQRCDCGLGYSLSPSSTISSDLMAKQGSKGILRALVSACMVPLLLLNVFGGIAAGIWLALLGRWRELGAGIGLMILASYVLAFVLGVLPTLAFAGTVAVSALIGAVMLIGAAMDFWKFRLEYRHSPLSDVDPGL